MTKPAHPHDPRRQAPQVQQPGIINDLAAELPPAAPQSMIINDVYTTPQGPGQQMIINDVPAGAGQVGGQQLIVNDGRYAPQAGAPQQMIVNDMAFTDLVKGLEALSKGEVPAAGNMVINDTGAAPQPGARQHPQPRPAPAAAPQPRTQSSMQVVSGQQQMPAPQRMQQVPMQQRAQPAPGPQQLPQPRQQMPAPQAAPQPPRQLPRQEAPVDPRQIRQQAQPQPMVINTPQPLIKPRREELLADPQPSRSVPSNRLAQENSPHQGTAAQILAESQASHGRGGRKAPAPVKKSQGRQDSAVAGGGRTEEWKGSYSGWTMTPSMILCIGLTALAGWFTIRYLPMDLWLEFLGASVGGIWLLQFVRWAYRVLGYRYRLTHDHLHLHRGLLYGKPVQVPRCQIMKVSVSASLLEKILGVGKVVVEVGDNDPSTVELEGVRRPKEVMQMIDPKKGRAV